MPVIKVDCLDIRISRHLVKPHRLPAHPQGASHDDPTDAITNTVVRLNVIGPLQFVPFYWSTSLTPVCMLKLLAYALTNEVHFKQRAVNSRLKLRYDPYPSNGNIREASMD